jgi:NAD(P) transhydrogenase subunit alpha
MIAQVRALGADGGWGFERSDYRFGQILVGMIDPLGAPQDVAEAAKAGLTCFALELVPRITRAQAMDVLSSQASLAGYKAVILAANTLPKIFPLMMTAAGTITASKILVIGAGVAGLQAIATARRLGAIVSGYDVRAAAKEQVESLGARFVQLDLGSDAEGTGGYARAMDAAYYAKQAELLLPLVAEQDVVICTAAVPGQKAPILIPRRMVEAMRPGSVIVDLAAERGGNCDLTLPGENLVYAGVHVLGPLNLASSLAGHASQLFSRNVASFVAHILREGELALDPTDQITRETLVARCGQVVHPRIRERLGVLPAPPTKVAAVPT